MDTLTKRLESAFMIFEEKMTDLPVPLQAEAPRDPPFQAYDNPVVTAAIENHHPEDR